VPSRLEAMIGTMFAVGSLAYLLSPEPEVTDVEVELTEVEEGGFIVLEFRPPAP
jgi:hypothetical protein